MTDAVIPQPFSSSTPAMVFILSTGRSGTKTIADYLSALDGCECLHEPAPRLVAQSSDFRCGRLSQDELAGILRSSRPLSRIQPVYGESSQILSLIIPALHAAFPAARYVWLVRNGLDMVASAVGRNWYTGLSMDGKPYDQTDPVGKEWIDGRVQGHLCGDVDRSEWERMTAFDKCCWYWGYVNRLIENDLRALIAPSAYRVVKLEELEASAGALAGWIGVPAGDRPLIPHQNRAHYPVYSHQQWSDSQWTSFERWCGALMDRMYPSWRRAHHYPRQLAAAECLIENDRLTDAENLFNDLRNSCTLDARAHNALGVLLVKKGAPHEARKHYEAAVASDPDNACFLMNLADLLLVAENQADTALDLYSRVLRQDPSNPQALLNKLVASRHLGRTQEAQATEASLHELSSHRPDIAQWLKDLKDEHPHLFTAIDRAASRKAMNSLGPSSATMEATSTPSPSSPPRPTTICADENPLVLPPCMSAPVHLQAESMRDAETGGLESRLEILGWAARSTRYHEVLSTVRRLRAVANPRIAVIVISWRPHPATWTNLKTLQQERDQGFELVFVDNGSPAGSFENIEEYIDTYVRLNTNTGAYLARNLGAVFANAPLLFFLEDDGIPAGNIVSAHLKAHDAYEVISVRGVCLPKTSTNRINSLAKHYYLGAQPFPWYVNLEGNASYRAEAFFSVGGWDDDNRFGAGGPELSRRLLNYDSDWCKQIYSPDPVILHDYAGSQEHLREKWAKQRDQMQRICQRDPDFKEFLQRWQSFYLRTDLVKPRAAAAPDSLRLESRWEAEASITRRVPLISIVIPTHNRCRLLQQAVESALTQTADNYEVIVVDDGSTDQTRHLLQGLACSRLHYSKKLKTGAPDTRNCGIEAAHGDFILWLDDDDVLSADAVATHTAVVARHPDADVIYGVVQEFDDRTARSTRLFDPKDWSLHADMLLSSLAAGCCLPNPGTMVRRSCYARVGRYDRDFSRAHDYEFWTRAAGHLNFRKNYNIVCRYRVHTTNLSAGKMVDRSFESCIIRRMLARYGLKRIYHWFDWSDPAAAEVAALYAVASNLFNIGDLHHSALFIEQIPMRLWTADVAELALNCMLFQGRWKHHGNLLERLKRQNILAPLAVKRFRQKTDHYWRVIQGLSQALAKKTPEKIAMYLKSAENDHFPLPPDCALQLAAYMLPGAGDRKGSLSISMNFLKKAMMADPANETIYAEICKLPIADADRDGIASLRSRMLADWDGADSSLLGACQAGSM